jgi:hypothetical protein
MKPMPVAPEIIPPSPAPDKMDELLSSDSLAGLELPQEKPTLVSKNADNPVAPTPVMAPVAGTGTERDGANRSRRYLSEFADGIVVLILLGVGMLVGEMVARKPSGMILREAASAPKFPPIDLLLWLGCAAFFALIYVWLGTRGWTLGAWLRRRGEV